MQNLIIYSLSEDLRKQILWIVMLRQARWIRYKISIDINLRRRMEEWERRWGREIDSEEQILSKREMEGWNISGIFM